MLFYFISRELSRFIAAGRLNCKIDKVGGVKLKLTGKFVYMYKNVLLILSTVITLTCSQYYFRVSFLLG